MTEQSAIYDGETQEEHTYNIKDESPHDYFSQIPNVVDELNLTPYAFRLYAHLRRVAGENGKCWQSTTTLSESCRMSAGSVSSAKRELEETFPPLIRVTSKMGDRGIYHEITITDIWIINHDFFTGESVHLVKSPPKRSPSEPERSPSEPERSPSETKKNTIKNNPDMAISKNKIANPPLEWQIASGEDVIVIPDYEDAKRKDIANLIATGIGVMARDAYELAYTFMTERNITIPESKTKGQRKAIKEMLDSKVKPQHIREAVHQLTNKNMTVVDLFSVTKTAIDLANQPQIEYTRLL